MPDFSNWADLPATPEDSAVTIDRVRQALGDNATPPIWARLIGFDTERKLNAVRFSVQRSQDALTDRTLTQPELEALAQYASEEGDAQINDHAIVVATALGLTLWGRKTMKFPLWGVRDAKTFTVFPSATQAWLKGRNARRAWHATRFVAYYISSSVTLGAFLSFSSTRNALTNKAIDPRLRDYLRESILDPQNQEILLMLQKERNVAPIEFRRQDDPWVIRAREIRRNKFYEEAEKHMSPNQREKTEERRRRHEQAEAEWRQRVAEAQDQKQTDSPVNAPDSAWSQRRAGTPPAAAQQQQQQHSHDDDTDPFSSNDDDDEDDMSPVPAYIRKQEKEAQKQKQQYQSGSAWDRLREKALQNDNQTSPNSSYPPSDASWGSESYSLTAEGSKNKSQQDFDSMLEAERRQGQENNGKWK